MRNLLNPRADSDSLRLNCANTLLERCPTRSLFAGINISGGGRRELIRQNGGALGGWVFPASHTRAGRSEEPMADCRILRILTINNGAHCASGASIGKYVKCSRNPLRHGEARRPRENSFHKRSGGLH